MIHNAFAHKMQTLGATHPDDQARLRAACSQSRTYRPRSDLIRDGEKPGPVFVILTGWAVRYKILPDGNRQIIAFMMPGDFCDIHVAVLDKMDHSIGALDTVTASLIHRSEMEILIGASDSLTLAFWRSQLIDAAILRSTIVSMGRRSSIDRVAYLLCELCLRIKIINKPLDGHYTMPFTQLILADATGITPVHVNRTLRRLNLAGLVDLPHGSIVVSNLPKLALYTGYDESYLHREAIV